MDFKKDNVEEEEEACLNAMLISSSHIFPMVFRAAMELDIFGIISKLSQKSSCGYVSASEIASQLPTKNQDAASMLDRILRLFVSHSVLSFSANTLPDGSLQYLYALTPTSNYFLADNATLAPLSALSLHQSAMEVWLHVKDAILEGGNMFKKVHGMTIFEYMNKEQEFNKIFNKAMGGLSTVVMTAILSTYKGFDGIKLLVDVGGGNGTVLNMIISKYPFIKGINYDLPHVVQTAPSFPGVEHVGGNMLTSVPSGDAIMIKDTCHNWSDENVIQVLKNIYEALPKNGKLIIMNAILPELPDTAKATKYVTRLDNTMLMQPSGKERTASQFQSLVMAAGFSNFHVSCVARGIWGVMESYK